MNNKSKILVRKGIPSDQEAIIEAQMAMAFESEGLKLQTEILQKGVRAVFDKPERGSYWIAEIEGNVAGMLLVVPEWSDWRNAEVWWIHSVYTWPQFRGQGVYRALYEKLKSIVESRTDLAGLRLYVEQENQKAQDVYRRLGMKSDHYFLFEWLK